MSRSSLLPSPPKAFPSRVSAVFALAILLAAVAAPAASAPRIVIEPIEVSASADLQWSFELRIVNSGEAGIYADSLHYVLTDTSPGAPGGGATRTFPMPGLASTVGSVSAGDSIVLQQTFPATFESGTLGFRLFAHHSDGGAITVESPALRLTPGPVSAEHPSEFLQVAGRKVEVVIFRSEKEGPAPGLLFLHDEGSHARQLLATGLALSRRGYTVAFASLPGHGQSEGPDDAAGAHTVAAAGAALDRLKHEPGVDPKRLAAWGVSQGATAVASLAGRRSDLAALVVQSGRFDAVAPRKGHAPTLVLHGEADASAGQARAFAARLEKAGVPVESKFLPGMGHALPPSSAQRAALAFLDARFMH